MVDYICGLLLNRSEQDTRPTYLLHNRKIILLISLITNLGILGVFKYYNFFSSSFECLLDSIGVDFNPAMLNVVLPVGISFYTFQTLGYTIDVYRRDVRAERNIIYFAVYVAFFPQLVAGPIERASQLLPQLTVSTSSLSWKWFNSGCYLIGWGLFKKAVIADNVAKVVDAVFSMPNPSGLTVLLGSYSFALQIYCDFSGYTDVARGTARCLGIQLMRNFQFPYLARNPTEFWSRWHISLSTWLRDYLYVPLGGNRNGTIRTFRNLMLTMILGGLWHGAGWTFLTWGFYHGCLLCLYRWGRMYLPEKRCFKEGKRKYFGSIIQTIIFFHLICIGWIFFRAQNLQQAIDMIAAIVLNPISEVGVLYLTATITIPCFLLLGVVEWSQIYMKDSYVIFKIPIFARIIVYSVFIIIFILFSVDDSQSFIYFQF